MSQTLRILLIEDDPDDAFLTRQALKEIDPSGFTLQTVESLHEALKWLAVNIPDLILSDLNLPDASGLETLQQLRLNVPYLPIVILSGHKDESLAFEAMKLGAQDYLVKMDMQGNTLSRAIRYAIERSRYEERVRQAEARNKAIIDSSLDCIIGMDESGNICEFNPAAERLFGYVRNEVLGKELAEVIIPAARRDMHRQGVSRFLSTRQSRAMGRRLEMSAVRSDGVEFPIELTITHTLHEGKVVFTGFIRDMSEKHRADSAVRRLAAVVESSNDGIILDWNKGAQEIYGYSAEEMTGKSIQFLAPKEKADEPITLNNKMKLGEPVKGYETVRVRKGGALIDVSITLSPIRDPSGQMIGAAIFVRNITERKRVEQQIRDQEELLRNVLSHIPHSVFWKDRNSVYLGCNENFAKDAGVPRPEDIVGKTDFDLAWKKEETEFYRKCDREVMDKGEPLVNVEEAQLQADGRQAIILTSKVPLRDSLGKVFGILGMYIDITETKNLEDHIQQIQKMEAIGNLAGGIAHDFNNILQVIGSCCHFLQGLPDVAGQARSDLGEIKDAVDRASNLTKQLLALGRRQMIRPVTLHMNELIENMSSLIYRVIGDPIRFELRLDPKIAAVKADPGQIEQVIINLVINARDAMPSGGVITVSTENVLIQDDVQTKGHLPEKGSYVKVSVKDTGTGIPESVRAHLFEPFFTTKEKGKGTGLGLATTYGIIKQSKGMIRVFSEEGQGAEFQIFLPHADEAVETVKTAAECESLPSGNETVLYAEDEETVRSLVARTLESQGYTVLACPSGEIALEVFEADREGRIKALLTDVMMPGMSGWELAEKIKALRPGLPVLFMSGYTDEKIIRQGIENPDVDFIQKPFSQIHFAAKVREILDRRSKTEES